MGEGLNEREGCGVAHVEEWAAVGGRKERKERKKRKI